MKKLSKMLIGVYAVVLLALGVFAVVMWSPLGRKLDVAVSANNVDFNPLIVNTEYWLDNNTNQTLQNVDLTLNEKYFLHFDSVDTNGADIALYYFCDDNGLRFDAELVKPVSIKIKCSKGSAVFRFE